VTEHQLEYLPVVDDNMRVIGIVALEISRRNISDAINKLDGTTSELLVRNQEFVVSKSRERGKAAH
jgi:CBS-domain-containing membrane protein